MSTISEANQNGLHLCTPVPELERLNFFYGQMLGVDDFRTEQTYFREKLKLHNRCLHGWGVVCGLAVEPLPVEEECEPEAERRWREVEECIKQLDAEITELQKRLEREEDSEELRRQLERKKVEREQWRRQRDCLPPRKHKYPEVPAKVVVHCGLALDCEGNELIVRRPLPVDLWSALSSEERRLVHEQGGASVYLSLCYCAQPTHPSRPVIPDSCGALSECNYGRYRDTVRVTVSLDPPAKDQRCEPCCQPCEVECVLLARICWDPSQPLTEADIDNSVRRPLALYPPTVITGVSWRHGATYTPEHAKQVLGTEHSAGARSDGLELQFSAPVYAETLAPGVVDLWRIQGEKGLRGVISHVEGSYVDKPEHGLITSVKYRDDSGETLNRGDRILIIVRASFILDRCCRPVDGEHVGGRILQLEAYRQQYQQKYEKEPSSEPCPCPPGGFGPWTSGNGRPGGTFESWFYIGEES